MNRQRKTHRLAQLWLWLLLALPLRLAAQAFTWYDGHTPVTYSLPSPTPPVVATAARMFADDMKAVTGQEALAAPAREARIQLCIRPSRTADNDGFRLYIREGQLIVEGNNARGAAYGLLELSRLAGVSPWIWWGDLVPQRQERLTLPADFRLEHTASVTYRGIFLNDEDWSLRPWACHTLSPEAPEGTIDAEAYRRVFHLLLRLRGNTIWPAMHEGTTAFFQVPGAKALADSCGIVIGTSHCEPLLRNNVGEWDVAKRGRYNYMTNRPAVQQYWTERLQEVGRGSEDLFTIGMRGIHDGAMEGVSTLQEKTDALQQVIDDQRRLLRRYISKDLRRVNQVFVPYKEVLDIYENGLRVPDDVTLMWCDDNYGYLTRLSDSLQQRRSGGAGVYYHLSYWGRPHDHLWLTTTQPGLIYNEMRQAWNHQVRRIWIANVHDPKVAGYDLELFLDMAWDIECVSAQSIPQHYGRWLCRQFGEEAGRRLLPAMQEFYRQCAIRRPEFMGWTQVELNKKLYHRGLSPVSEVEMDAWEAAERMAALERIKATVIEARPWVRPELQDAYFAAITYPVFATAAMSTKILADSASSRRAYQEIRSLTEQYNALQGGKWRGLMDAHPRKLPVFEAVNARLRPADATPTATRIVRQACEYDQATPAEEIHPVQMLGHSNQAVPLPKGGKLTYRFTTEAEGEASICVALIPTQANDKGDIRLRVRLDEGEPQVFSLKEPFRSERWKLNVLRGQALRSFRQQLKGGTHTLTIEALDAHIVVDQWMVDFAPERRFYLIR